VVLLSFSDEEEIGYEPGRVTVQYPGFGLEYQRRLTNPSLILHFILIYGFILCVW